MKIERFCDTKTEEVKHLVLGVLKERGFEYDPVKDFDLDDINAQYLENGGMFFIGTVDRKVIGTSAVYKINNEKCEIKRIYVKKEYRGRGYGRQLFLQALDYAKIYYPLITIKTDSSLTEAISMYKKYGFSVIKEENCTIYFIFDT